MTTLLIDDLASGERANVIALMSRRELSQIQERAKTEVARLLGGHPRLVTAQHRAANNVAAGVEMNAAVRRAVAWAQCAIDPNDPEAA